MEAADKIATLLNVSINDIIFLESNLQNVESKGETKKWTNYKYSKTKNLVQSEH